MQEKGRSMTAPTSTGRRHLQIFGACCSILQHAHVLCCCVPHVFNKNAISGGGVVDEDMGHGANEAAILNNRRAEHK